ncbi:MAG: hypothetical protein IKY36_00130 [Bacteroidales bacterium]|nr:hypothetical protein [Bacteroidales bacterium]
MKLNKLILSLMAAFSFLAVSCQVEEQVYVPGEPDLEGCHGVYFPTQEAAGSHTMDPSETPAVEFVVKRLTEDGDITVPVVVKASEEGIFELSELKFADGQTESTIKVSFSKAQPGVTYTLSLEITDPEYALVYGQNPTYLNYSVIIEKYDLLGKATIREGLITGYQQNPTGIEWEVEVYTKETTPGWYYFKDAYISAPFNQGWEQNKGWDMIPSGSYLTINAENPARVYMPFQNLGCNWSYGWMYAGSIAPEAGITGGTPTYGTLVDGVISFPANSMAFAETEYNNGALSVSNTEGMFRICLPGAILVDYTVEIISGYTRQGQHPVQFTFGTDVHTIKYLAYEGALSSEELQAKVSEVLTSENAQVITKDQADEEGNVVVALSFEQTGKYTIVAVGFDKDAQPQTAVAEVINYVAADSPVPVVVNAGLILSDKYAPEGYTSENSLEFYIYGSDITEAGFSLFRTSDWMADQSACLNAVMTTGLISSEAVDMINGGGLSDIYYNLNAGTEYTLVVYASNGFEQTVITADAKTAGVADPLQEIYSMDSLWGAESKDEYLGEWGYYFSDPEAGNKRFDMGTPVTVSDAGSQTDPETGDVYEYVGISGFFQPAVDQGIIADDTMYFEYWNGALVSLQSTFGPTLVDLVGTGTNQYAGVLSIMGSGAGGIVSAAAIGAFTDFGDVAFVDFGQYASYGGFAYFSLGVFADEAYSSYIASLMDISNLLLVDPENMPKDEQQAAIQNVKMGLEAARADFYSNFNCVETEDVQIKKSLLNLPKKGQYERAYLNIESANPMVEFNATVSVGEKKEFTFSNERVPAQPLR